MVHAALQQRGCLVRHPGLFPGIAPGIWDLRGEDFPPHLQKAFGRAVFRLLHRPPAVHVDGCHFHRGLIYLRDLPLNLLVLDAQGYPWARSAYDYECCRTGEGAVI